jgi:glycosyltransferase involved in cell wall biosynthesis
MNIAFVNSTHKWGGVKTWTLDVARGLADRGHGVLIAGRPGPFTDKARDLGLDTLPLLFGPDFNPALIFKFLRLFKARNIDRVMVNVAKDMRTAGVAAKLLAIPVIHRVGLAGDMENTLKIRAMHKWVRPRILVPCEQIRQGVHKELPFLSPDEITVIMTGKKIAQDPLDSVHDPLRFISTSQLNADKGHREVLTALAELKKKGHRFTYHVVGTGSIEHNLKEMASRLDLDNDVVWHGFQKDVRSLLIDCDVFILASHKEGLPNSLLEAMSQGLACVATDAGGIREVWHNKFPPLLPVNSPDALARTLGQLLSETSSRIRERQEQTLIHARQTFSLAQALTSLESWLEQASMPPETTL